MNETGQYFYLKGRDTSRDANNDISGYDNLCFILSVEDSGHYLSYLKHNVFPQLAINDYLRDFQGEVFFINGNANFEDLFIRDYIQDDFYSGDPIATGEVAVRAWALNDGVSIGELSGDNSFGFADGFIDISKGDSTLLISNFEVALSSGATTSGFNVLDASGAKFLEIIPNTNAGTGTPYGAYIRKDHSELSLNQIASFYSDKSNTFFGTDIFGQDINFESGYDVFYDQYTSSFFYNGGKSKYARNIVSFNKGNFIDINSTTLTKEVNDSFVFGNKSYSMGDYSSSIGYSCLAYDFGHAENAGLLKHPQSSIDSHHLDVRKEIELLSGSGLSGYLFSEDTGLANIADCCNLMNFALGTGAFVEGQSNYVRGNYSHGQGFFNQLHSSDLNIQPSHVEGASNKIGISFSHSEGSGNQSYFYVNNDFRGGTNGNLNSHIEGVSNYLVGDATVGGKNNTVLNKTSTNSGNSIIRDSVYGYENVPSHVFGEDNQVTGAGNHVIGHSNRVNNSFFNLVRGKSNIITSDFGENVLNAAKSNQVRRFTFSEGDSNESDFSNNFFKGSFCKSFFNNGFLAGEGKFSENGDCQYFETKLTNHIDLYDWINGDPESGLELFIKTCDEEEDTELKQYLTIPNFSNVNFDVEFTITSSNGLYESGIEPKPIHSTFKTKGRITREVRGDRLVADSFGYSQKTISGTEFIDVSGANLFYQPCHYSQTGAMSGFGDLLDISNLSYYSGSGEFSSPYQNSTYSDFVQPKISFSPSDGKLSFVIEPIDISQLDDASLTGGKDYIFAEAKIMGNILTKDLGLSDEIISLECLNTTGNPDGNPHGTPPTITIVPPPWNPTTIIPETTIISTDIPPP